MSPSNLPNKKITSGTRSDSHLLGQESEVYSDHSSGGSLGSFSFGEDSTTIANTQQGIVGKVLLDEVAESTSTKSSEDASEKQLKSGNKKSFKTVVHDYEVSSPEWDANASKFFRRWGFAKYGRKKGCPRCKELYEKGSSSQKHTFTCPCITGVQESSTSSDEIDEDLLRNKETIDAWNFSDDSGNITEPSKKVDKSTNIAKTSVEAVDDSSVSVQDTVGEVIVNVDDASPSLQDTGGEVFVNVEHPSSSVPDTVDELVI